MLRGAGSSRSSSSTPDHSHAKPGLYLPLLPFGQVGRPKSRLDHFLGNHVSPSGPLFDLPVPWRNGKLPTEARRQRCRYRYCGSHGLSNDGLAVLAQRALGEVRAPDGRLEPSLVLRS